MTPAEILAGNTATAKKSSFDVYKVYAKTPREDGSRQWYFNISMSNEDQFSGANKANMSHLQAFYHIVIQSDVVNAKKTIEIPTF